MCAREGYFFEKKFQSRENQAKIFSIAKKYSKKSETLIRGIIVVNGEWIVVEWIEIVIIASYPQQFELLEAIVKRIVARRGKYKRKKRRQP
jgi:hypothetical protein